MIDVQDILDRCEADTAQAAKLAFNAKTLAIGKLLDGTPTEDVLIISGILLGQAVAAYESEDRCDVWDYVSGVIDRSITRVDGIRLAQTEVPDYAAGPMVLMFYMMLRADAHLPF